MRVLSYILALLFPCFQSNAWGDYFDSTAGSLKEVYAYLDTAEVSVGIARIDRLPYDRTLALAKTLGLLDRENVSPETFVRHLECLEEIKSLRYKPAPLTDSEIESYLLPIRLRYEINSRGKWLPELSQRSRTLAEGIESASEAAQVLLYWVANNIEVINSGFTYPIGSRGDLDPISTLRLRSGSEIDVSIFATGFLRSAGIAARLVWAPAIREGRGGKVWLEYMNDNREWCPWVPSYGNASDHSRILRRSVKQGFVVVMAQPDRPIEITESYTDVVEVILKVPQEQTSIGIMVIGAEGLLIARGPNHVKSESGSFRVGAGAVVIAASFVNKQFAILPLDIQRDSKPVLIIEKGEVRTEN